MMEENTQLPDIGAAVQTLKPQLWRQSTLAAVGMGAAGSVAFVVSVWGITAMDDSRDAFKVPLVAVILGVFALVICYNQMRKAQEALVMPVVAQAIGLSYRKDAKAFLKGLPERLLPKSALKSAEDYIYGTLGNHSLQMAEVKAETGGKNSRTLFQGVVAQFPNRVAMPAFFIAETEQTRPGMIFSAWIKTDGLYHLRDMKGPSGKTYGIWTSWTDREEPPALSAVVEALMTIETRLGVPVTLFTATSNGEEMHVALSHSRNLFRIGGFFPQEAQLFSDVHGAMTDLMVPVNLVRELVAAELAAAEKIKGA